MTSDYITWFKDKDSKSRALLYKLENEGIAKLSSKKEDNGFYEHKWELTEKGKNIVDKNKSLQELWKSGNIEEFYNKILKYM